MHPSVPLFLALGVALASQPPEAFVNVTKAAVMEPVSRDSARSIIEDEQKNELPIINGARLDPKLLLVCDDLLSPDDIYTGLITVLVRIEDTLREKKCNKDVIQIHDLPLTVNTLMGKLRDLPLPTLEEHPVVGTFIDTMRKRTQELLEKAEKCQLDYVLLMKIVRMSLKMLVNRINCTAIKTDIMRNKAGFGARRRADETAQVASPPRNIHQMGYGFAEDDLDATGSSRSSNGVPFTRYGPSVRDGRYQNWQEYFPHIGTSRRRALPGQRPSSMDDPLLDSSKVPTVGGEDSMPKKWPYYPDGYSPSSVERGSVDGENNPLSEVITDCPDCEKNRNVIDE